MRRIIPVLLIPMLFAFAGCSYDYTIEVRGTSGLEFSGAISEGGTIYSVEGKVPKDYSVSGDYIGGTFQKETEEGRLTAKIVQEGGIFASGVVDEATTTAAYGVVSVSYSP